MTHTPGPWFIATRRKPHKGFLIVGPTGISLGCTYGAPGDQEAGNARLMAAAPDLFKAASAIVDAWDGEDQLPEWAIKLLARSVRVVKGGKRR